MILAGLAIGFRTSTALMDWLAIVGLLVLFTLGFSQLAAIIGVLAKSVKAVQ